jgi:hypothetical protein
MAAAEQRSCTVCCDQSLEHVRLSVPKRSRLGKRRIIDNQPYLNGRRSSGDALKGIRLGQIR